MAAAFSDTGTRHQVQVGSSSKNLAPSGILVKQQVPGKSDSRQEVPSKLLTNAPPAAPTVSTQIDEYSGDPNFGMTSLARGLAVIQAFSQRQRELTVSLNQREALKRSLAPPYGVAFTRLRNLASQLPMTAGIFICGPAFSRSATPTFLPCR